MNVEAGCPKSVSCDSCIKSGVVGLWGCRVGTLAAWLSTLVVRLKTQKAAGVFIPGIPRPSMLRKHSAHHPAHQNWETRLRQVIFSSRHITEYFTYNHPHRLPSQNNETISESSGSLWYLCCTMASAEVASFYHHQPPNTGLGPHKRPTPSISRAREKINGPITPKLGNKRVEFS